VDKLDASAVRDYLTRYLDLHQAAMRAKLGDATVQNLLTDSWEAGVQNWTRLCSRNSNPGGLRCVAIPAGAGGTRGLGFRYQ